MDRTESERLGLTEVERGLACPFVSTDRMEPTRLTLSVEEAASVLGIGRGLAYEMARRGALPTIRFGRRLLVPRARLEAMLEADGGQRSADGGIR